MGFFAGLGKMMQGKPVFDTQAQNTNDPAPREPMATTPVHSEQNTAPLLHIEKTDCHENGAHASVLCHIKNASQQNVELEKMHLLGSTLGLNTWLRPGESREFRVYSGNYLSNRNYNRAEIVYKNEQGTYFEAICRVEFKQEPGNLYSIYRITVEGPPKHVT